jgi:putative redox protein
VELQWTYQRTFAEDCEHCETDGKYEESIEQEIILGGKLSPGERKRLLRVAGYCPIHKILSEGISVKLHLAEGKAPATPDQRE